MQNTKTPFTDACPASDVPEADWLAVADVLLPAVDAGVVLEVAVAVSDAAEAADDDDDNDEATELEDEGDTDLAAPPFLEPFPPECE